MKYYHLSATILLTVIISTHISYAQHSTFYASYRDTTYNILAEVHYFGQIPSNTIRESNNTYLTTAIRGNTFTYLQHNSNGSPIYGKQYAPACSPYLSGNIIQTTDGGIVNVYQLDQVTDNSSVGILKTNVNGEVVFSKKLNTWTTMSVFGATAVRNNRFITGGGGCVGFNVVTCLNGDGNIEWYKNVSDPISNSFTPSCFYATNDSNIKVSGSLGGLIELFDINDSGVCGNGAIYTAAVPGGNLGLMRLARSKVSDIYYWGCSIDNNTATVIIGASDGVTDSLLWSKQLTFDTLNGGLNSPCLYALPSGELLVTVALPFLIGSSTILRTVLVKMDSLGNVENCKRAGTATSTGLSYESEYGGLYNPEDSTIFMTLVCDSGLAIARVDPNDGKMCTVEDQPYVETKFGMSSQSVSFGAGSGFIDLTAISCAVTELGPEVNYFCSDTTQVPLTTGVNNSPLLQEVWKVYPIPASDEIFISGGNTSFGIVTVTLYNVAGTKMKEYNYNVTDQAYRITTDDLADGVYMYHIEDKKGHRQVGKISVIR